MAETIGDYLVKLGLQVDKAQEQRFNAALSNLGKTLTTMAAGLAAAATAIQATVIAVSKSFDNLYFAAQRTGATVAGIKSLSYAFSQIGGSADEAMGAISGLAKAMRTNPEGMTKWLNFHGVETKGKDIKQILMDAADVFAKKDYRISHQFAERIGIPEETWNKWVKNRDEIRRFEKEYAETQAKFSVDPKEAAKNSNELMTSFRSLLLHVQALLDKITVALQPQLNQIMKDIGDWFEKHQDQIVSILNKILEAAKAMIRDFGELAKKLEPVVSQFLAMVEAITGKNGLEAALLVVTAGALAAFVAKWMVLFAGFAKWAPLLGLLTAMGWDIFLATDQEKISLGGGVNDAINGKASDPDSAFTRGQNWARRKLGLPEVDNKGQPKAQGGASGSYGNGGASGSWNGEGVNPELQRRYDKMLAEAPESVRNAVSVNSARRTYEEQKRLYEKYGPGRAAPPGRSPHEKGEAFDLHFGTPEALAWFQEHSKEYGLTSPLPSEPWHWERAERRGQNPNWQDDATRLKDKQSELFNAPPLGSGAARTASLSNRTNITIYGSTDPAGTAANLGGAQNRIASELIRNTQSAFV